MAADNEIKVLLTAELGDLKAGMDAAAESVAASSEAMAASAVESAEVINAAHGSVAEAAEAAADRIKAMVAASIEQAAADAGLAESETSLAERMGARVEATDAQLDATAAAIAAQNEQMAATTAQVRAETAVAEATEAATVATEANTEALVINGGVAREVGVLTGEALRGNWTRLEGSSITLANRLNLLQYAFTPLGLAIIGSLAGVYELVSGYMAAVDRTNEFNAALLTTGDSVGMTADQLREAADSLAAFSGDSKSADEIMQRLASSGKLTGDALVNAGTGASNIMRLTGESADQAAKEIEKLADNPAKSVVELNNKFHFLTVELYDQIVALQRNGKEYEATELAAKAFADNTSGRIQKLNEQMGFFEQTLQDAKVTFSLVDHGLQKFFDPTLAQKSIQSTHEWFQAQEALNEAIKRGASAADIAKLREREEAYKRTALALREQVRAEQDNASTQGAQASAAAATIRQEAAAKPDSSDSGTASASRVQTQSLQQQLAIQESLDKVAFDQRTQYELKFWQDKLATLKQGTAEYAQAYGQVAALTARADQARAQAAQQAAQQQAQIEQIEEQSARAHSNAMLELKKQEIAAAFQLGQINASQELQQLAQLEQQKYEVELASLQRERAALAAKPAEVARINAQILALEDQHNKAMATLNQKAALDNQKMWQDRLRPISQAFQGVINGFIQGTQNWRQATAKLLESVAAEYIQKGIEIVVNHAANEAAKTTATAAGAATRTTIEATAAAQSKATDAATGKSQIGTAAATGAAKAYQAIVGIPYVGPILAPIAAGVAFAGIEAFSASIASARGGWDRVPFDGAMTELHKDEMVLPKPLADGVRQMTKAGQGGGAPQVHLHTTDPRSFKDYMRRNPGAIASAVKLAGRRGHMLGAR